MRFNCFSEQQQKVISWWLSKPDMDGIICDGSIRSGKTVAMTIGFIFWSMTQFDRQNFALCGKTIEALRRNVTSQIAPWVEGIEECPIIVTERRSENKIIIQMGGCVNTYFLFGGRDESSYTLIQGLTLAGVLFDEVALMPRSFVEQALARCSVTGSKYWFNCNPDTPQHWFYQEWVLRAKEKNVLHLHFTMKDNLSLSPNVIERYENLFSGVFYDRYIRGLWVVAEGLIYTMFDTNVHVVPTVERPYECYMVSCDYGTINPMSIGLWGLCQGKWYRTKEYYFDSRQKKRQKTDEEYYADLEQLIGALPIERVIVDPSAASFIECVRKHGRLYVQPAKNDVLNGIRDVATQLQQGNIFFNDCCKDSIREFGLYRWDEKATEDRPLKTNDHAMDDVRYFVHTAFAPRRFGF